MAIEQAKFTRWVILTLFLLNILFLHFFLHIFLIEIDKIQLSKTCASISALSWFGSTVSWPSFKRRYLNHSSLRNFTSLIDGGVFQGQILLESILKRFNTLHLRAGLRYYSPKNLALAIGGGIASAFERSDNIEDSLYLKSKTKAQQLSQACLSLQACSVIQNKQKILSNIS